jgi:hypothetical protein
MNSLDKRPWYNRDKAIGMGYYDEADMVLKVNSMFGENVTMPISNALFPSYTTIYIKLTLYVLYFTGSYTTIYIKLTLHVLYFTGQFLTTNIPNLKNNKMFNLNTNTFHGNQATFPVICTLSFQQGV